MREIKFKFYCDESYTMSRIFTLEELANGRYDFHCDINKAIKLQYTGLKDKNGVEIYEGDIIKKEKDIVVIKYSEYHTSFQVYYNISMSSKTSLYEFGYSKELEIIGNIYENPELLKEGI